MLAARVLNVVRKAKGRSSRDVAERIVEALRQAVPVDQGDLRDSIRMVDNKNGTITVIVGGTPTTMKEIRAGGPRIFDVALGIEYGTSTRAAHPFFWVTVERFRDEIERSLGRALEEELS